MHDHEPQSIFGRRRRDFRVGDGAARSGGHDLPGAPDGVVPGRPVHLGAGDDDFAGQHTASGAIYDPRLFTLANKELPLGVFLRIHYKGKCAIALVNDRGPYGVQGRIFDVSEAIAEYLGYKGAGVAYVTTDVLVPAR